VPALVEHFLAKYAGDAGKRITTVAPEALDRLTGHDWPGNVRELENVIHRSLLVASGPELGIEDLPAELQSGPGSPPPAVSVGVSNLAELEKNAILAALEQFGGNLSDAARQLGIGRSTLYRKLEQYGLRSKKGE
jgi:DNA-binding NtrC family response regulator